MIICDKARDKCEGCSHGVFHERKGSYCDVLICPIYKICVKCVSKLEYEMLKIIKDHEENKK